MSRLVSWLEFKLLELEPSYCGSSWSRWRIQDLKSSFVIETQDGTLTRWPLVRTKQAKSQLSLVLYSKSWKMKIQIFSNLECKKVWVNVGVTRGVKEQDPFCNEWPILKAFLYFDPPRFFVRDFGPFVKKVGHAWGQFHRLFYALCPCAELLRQ